MIAGTASAVGMGIVGSFDCNRFDHFQLLRDGTFLLLDLRLEGGDFLVFRIQLVRECLLLLTNDLFYFLFVLDDEGIHFVLEGCDFSFLVCQHPLLNLRISHDGTSQQAMYRRRTRTAGKR